MAKNPFSENSPLALQFKSELPTLLKSQLNTLANLPGNLSAGKGIQSDVTAALDQLTNNASASLEIATNLSSSLASSGLSEKIRKDIMSSSVSPSVFNKTNLSTAFPGNPVDLFDLYNRLPPPPENAALLIPSEVMKRATEKLVGAIDANYGGRHFPLDIKDGSAEYTYMRLSFQVYTRTNALTVGTVDSDKQIYLPLPENYQHAYAVTYEEKNLGLLRDLEAGVRKDEAEAVRNSEGLQKRAISVMGQRGAAQLGESLGLDGSADLAASYLGEIPSPHPSIFFQGVPLRSFNWNWKLVPRNAQEANEITEIIRLIKQAILPKGQGTSTLQYPDLVIPSIMRGSEQVEDLGTFKKCSCTGLNINYTAEGTSAFFHDGKPVSVNIGMELKEIEMFLAEDVR